MYITEIPNHGSKTTLLLRESYRQDGKVKNRSIANLNHWPEAVVAALRTFLKGGTAIPSHFPDSFRIVRSRPHGHVAAVLGTLQKLRLDTLLSSDSSRAGKLVVAMIVDRLLGAGSKLLTARDLNQETLTSSLGEELSLGSVDEDELYQAMDWLLEQQQRIEKSLAKRHLKEGSLVLCDVTSTYFEGRHCPLAQFGYSRDHRKDRPQVVFGLLCNVEGCPVGVEVFEGNVSDSTILSHQVQKVQKRYGMTQIVMVGDRGSITNARIREELSQQENIQWVTALRADQIRKLVEAGSLQLSLFDRQDLAEITDFTYPGERLVVCKNPLLAAERKRKRADLLESTQKELDKIVTSTQRSKNPLRGKDKIALRVGKVLNRFKVAKHFQLTIAENSFHYERAEETIAAEAALDGIYVVRTNVSSQRLNSEETVKAYKSLSHVERAFRTYKGIDLKVRPIYHHLAARVRSHIFLCMLAYYVEWHMRQALAPILFEDDDKAAAEAARTSVVAPAQRSASAKAKALTKRTEDGMTVHSFQSLLADLGTIVKNRIEPQIPETPAFDQLTEPTALQARALQLLGVRLKCSQ